MYIGTESSDWESGDSALKAATVQRTLHVTEMDSSVDSADEDHLFSGFELLKKTKATFRNCKKIPLFRVNCLFVLSL
jgi:hypothetical protein